MSGGSVVESEDTGDANLSLAEWKSQQVQKKAQSTRERLRDEYAKQAALIKLGDRCDIGGYKGEVVFIGDEVEGLPGGHWVGIRYDEPVGKNDGTIKGTRLFHCSPNCGHLVRPDKVLQSIIASPSARRPAAVPARQQRSASPTRSSSDDDDLPPRPHSMTVAELSPGKTATPDAAGASHRTPPRARSFSPVGMRTPELVTKAPDPANKRWEKWRKMDPATVIGTDPQLEETAPRKRTGLVYDTRMETHCSPTFHPEQPLRITAIFAALAEQGLAQRCWRVPARAATAAELTSVHTASHVQTMCNLAHKSQGDLNDMAAKLDSVYLCPASSEAALLASGSVVEATRLVATGKLQSACCVVRPPGHHALPSCAMGFCLFGNVAVAAAEARRRGWAQRVLILDWDVHHGNGTQKMFWEDNSVLFFSVHRYENGNFYPGGPEGDETWAGEGAGLGYNVNVPWPKAGAGDEEYRMVVDRLLRPIAREYKPDLVLISAGFDAALGDPLGGCKITPEGYYMMTKACREFAHGKVVLALEGGYSLRATSQCMAACVAALLDKTDNSTHTASPSTNSPKPFTNNTSTDSCHSPAQHPSPAHAPLPPQGGGREDTEGGASCDASAQRAEAGKVYVEAIEEARRVQAHFWKSVRREDDELDFARFRTPSPHEGTPRTPSGAASPSSSSGSSFAMTPPVRLARSAGPRSGGSDGFGGGEEGGTGGWEVRRERGAVPGAGRQRMGSEGVGGESKSVGSTPSAEGRQPAPASCVETASPVNRPGSANRSESASSMRSSKSTDASSRGTSESPAGTPASAAPGASKDLEIARGKVGNSGGAVGKRNSTGTSLQRNNSFSSGGSRGSGGSARSYQRTFWDDDDSD